MQLVDRPLLSLIELERWDPGARQVGHEIRFLCPLGSCGEGKRADTRHRSLSVNLESGLWVCQRCKASGKIREKWAPRERLSPRARAQRAFGLTAPHPARPVAAAPTSTQTTPASTTKVPAWRRMWDQAPPIDGTPGADYLRSRGILLETAAAAGVRFVEGWPHRTQDQDGAWRLEATSRRVIFPIQDQVGELVGIQGRAIDARHAGAKAISYGVQGVFSTTGLPTTIGRRSRVVLVEAPIDALSLAVAGVHALSLQGTSWPEWLPRAVAFGSALLAFDADAAGDAAAAKLTSALRAYGVDVARRRPSRKDWNELVKRGPRQVRVEVDAEAWDRQLADDLIAATLDHIAHITAELSDGDVARELEDRITSSYQQRRLTALRVALEDYVQNASEGFAF
jgi:hypothetical protein